MDIDTQPIDQNCFAVSKRHNQITGTRSIRSSRRWWSSTIWRHYERISGKVRWLIAMVRWWLVNLPGKKRRRTQEKVSMLIEPSLFQTILVFQRNSRTFQNTPVDPTLQDNVLLPDDFTKYIFHVGNICEMHSIIRGGLIPGGRSLRRDRQAVFFTTVNPMDEWKKLFSSLDKPRIAPYKNTWRPYQNTVYWCKLKVAQKRGLQF